MSCLNRHQGRDRLHGLYDLQDYSENQGVLWSLLVSMTRKAMMSFMAYIEGLELYASEDLDGANKRAILLNEKMKKKSELPQQRGSIQPETHLLSGSPAPALDPRR